METPIDNTENQQSENLTPSTQPEVESAASSSAPKNLSINQVSEVYLTTTAKWAKFLGVCGFVFTGLIVLAAFFMGTIIAQAGEFTDGIAAVSGGFFTVMYLLLGLLYFFPSLYVFQYGNRLQGALLQKDEAMLTEAFKNQKSLYLFMGITMAIVIGFYIFAALIGAMVAVFAA